MAKRKKRKSQPVAMPQEDTGKMVIEINDSKIGWGHMAHASGCGAHSDKRFRRRRTRGAMRRKAIADSNG